MDRITILWVDDEIELLKPHFLFLESKGYTLTACNNGRDALELVAESHYDVVLLDENMPGLNGLETLSELKQKKPQLPVIMITKNEEEQIMNEAIGAKIADYLIKPVNPNQILLTLKKNLNHQHLIAEKTTKNYQQEFGKISQEISQINTHEGWVQFYRKMVFWELELEALEDTSLLEIFESQKKEANAQFARFVKTAYPQWMQGDNPPLLSHQVFQKAVFPKLTEGKPHLLLVIDNLRWDQWRVIAKDISSLYAVEEESAYYSLLPTATAYARNALFAGLTPLEIHKRHPQWWLFDDEMGGKNNHEENLLEDQIERLQKKISFSYHKITQLKQGQQLIKQLGNHTHEQLTVVVYNFVDMISHAKTEMEMIKELAPNNKAYRSLTRSWFANSPLKALLQKAASLGFQLLLTTDHGTINVEDPVTLISHKEASTNLRYKAATSLTYDHKNIVACSDPKSFQLPSQRVQDQFIFATSDQYFVYKKDFHHYAQFYKNSFQHGGISLEEMIVPFVVLRPRG